MHVYNTKLYGTSVRSTPSRYFAQSSPCSFVCARAIRPKNYPIAGGHLAVVYYGPTTRHDADEQPGYACRFRRVLCSMCPPCRNTCAIVGRIARGSGTSADACDSSVHFRHCGCSCCWCATLDAHLAAHGDARNLRQAVWSFTSTMMMQSRRRGALDTMRNQSQHPPGSRVVDKNYYNAAAAAFGAKSRINAPLIQLQRFWWVLNVNLCKSRGIVYVV